MEVRNTFLKFLQHRRLEFPHDLPNGGHSPSTGSDFWTVEMRSILSSCFHLHLHS